MMPGSPERILLGRIPGVTQQVLDVTKARWGLDKPLFPDQFVDYVVATAQGDLGYSFTARGRPVTDVLGQRIGPTLLLFGLGEIVAIILGLALGAYSGWRRGGLVDYVGNGVSLILYSTPYFVLGMALLLLFATGLGWFPTFGMSEAGKQYAGPFDELLDVGRHLVLPLATVALGLVGQYAILMRSSVVETMSEDYITTARAKGLSDGRVLRRHALPNALLPTVTLIAINLGYVVAGAITVEVVFNWPGLGTLTVDALEARDYPVLQGVFLLLSVSVVVANLVADLLYGLLDPRVRT
ncbi:MAG: ABC transporter permease [Chloroflexi bacterium]|nr:ABC transporter permease [Chloroflexota bacterium]